MNVQHTDLAPILEHLTEIPYRPQYQQMGRPGALSQLLLHPLAARRLRRARAHVRRASRAGRTYDLIIWDAYRPHSVQLDIFNGYVHELIATGMTEAEAAVAAVTFVRHPDGVYPHGTGGTVDLSLTVNGEPAKMGTGFDDFTHQAHRRWYIDHPPVARDDCEARDNRSILDASMLRAGFVGIPDEWWHYEWGTKHWATVTGRRAVLTATIDRPTDSRVAS